MIVDSSLHHQKPVSYFHFIFVLFSFYFHFILTFFLHFTFCLIYCLLFLFNAFLFNAFPFNTFPFNILPFNAFQFTMFPFNMFPFTHFCLMCSIYAFPFNVFHLTHFRKCISVQSITTFHGSFIALNFTEMVQEYLGYYQVSSKCKLLQYNVEATVSNFQTQIQKSTETI